MSEVVIEHRVPTSSTDLFMVLQKGATLYELTIYDTNGQVTVYLSHPENRDLMYDVGAVVEALDAGTSYAGSVRTMGGVIEHRQPTGLIRTVLEPSDGPAPALIVTDGMSTAARVNLDRAGLEQLLVGAALMAGHL